jgi:hypothetical protein
MVVEEGRELERRAPCAQLPTLKIRSKIEILETQISQKKNRRDGAASSAQVSEK